VKVAPCVMRRMSPHVSEPGHVNGSSAQIHQKRSAATVMGQQVPPVVLQVKTAQARDSDHPGGSPPRSLTHQVAIVGVGTVISNNRTEGLSRNFS